MKRSPIARKTPLKRTEIVKKPTKAQPGWAKAVEIVKARSNGMCEIKTSDCTGVGTSTHHRLRRSQGGMADPAILARICLHCDAYLEANPAEAYANGWLLHRWSEPTAEDDPTR